MIRRRSTRRLRPCRIKGRRQCHLTSSSRQRPQSVRAVVRINSCLWWTITDIPRRATILRNVGRWRMGRNGIYTTMTRVRLFRTRCLEVIRILCGLSGYERSPRNRKPGRTAFRNGCGELLNFFLCVRVKAQSTQARIGG